MSEIEIALRETARQLLADGQVDVVIGYASGTLPLRTTPCFVDDPEQVDQLVWNASCENTLATYLQNMDGKVGIVAKGCDARAIVTKIVEHQVERENVVILGVPCQGVIDRQRIEAQLGGARDPGGTGDQRSPGAARHGLAGIAGPAGGAVRGLCRLPSQEPHRVRHPHRR